MLDDNEIKEIHRKLDLILSAFPLKDGHPDPTSHRQYHEEAISQIEDNKKLIRELKLTVAKGTLWAFICFLGWSLLEYIKQRLLNNGH